MAARTGVPCSHTTAARGFVWKLFPITPKLIYAALQSQDGSYRVAKTIDGGENWEVLIAARGRPTVPAVQGIGFVDANTGWIGGFFFGHVRDDRRREDVERSSRTRRDDQPFREGRPVTVHGRHAGDSAPRSSRREGAMTDTRMQSA